MSFASAVHARRLTGILLLVLACGTRAWSQTDAQPMLTLEQATAIAIDNNRLVKIKALYSREMARHPQNF